MAMYKTVSISNKLFVYCIVNTNQPKGDKQTCSY